MNPVATFFAALFLALPAWPSLPADEKDRNRFISSFGKSYLAEAHIVAEVEVEKVWTAGLGVTVARMRLKTVLYDELTPEARKKVPVLVLCHKGEFVEGIHLLLFLGRFRGGGRCVCQHRRSMLDHYYHDKVRLIGDYIAVEKIADRVERQREFKRLLLKNMNDRSPWIRWNSLHELDGLIESKRVIFTKEDADTLAAAAREVNSESFRKALQRIRKTILERIENK